METFVASVEAALWLEDVLAGFAIATPQTPLLVDDEGHSHEVPAELIPIFKQLADDFAHGRAVSIVTHERLMTTQAAADFIGVSRPTLIKLLKEYQIPFSVVGTHRRIEFQAIQSLRILMKEQQRKALREMRLEQQLNGEYANPNFME